MLRAYGASATMTERILLAIERLVRISIPWGVLSVYLALSRHGIHSVSLLTTARFVRNTMSNQPVTNEDSVENVTVRFLFDLDGTSRLEFLQKKCPKCKTITPQSWFKVGVSDLEGQTDPVELLKLYKRVVLCHNCGNISVTN